MKRAIWLLPLALALSACGPLQPLGYCASTDLFYYRIGNSPVRSATPAQVQAQGFDPYGYGSWCPVVAPTATPTNTAEPPTATPTDTTEPPSPTPTDTAEPPTPTETWEPTATQAAEPTATLQGPTPTAEPPERKPRVVIEKAWLLVNEIDGRWCVLLSNETPGRGVQGWKCFPELAGEGQAWVATGAPCAGPIYDNDVWSCDDDSLRWRIARWPDASWLHGSGRLSLNAICSRYPEYCDD